MCLWSVVYFLGVNKWHNPKSNAQMIIKCIGRPNIKLGGDNYQLWREWTIFFLYILVVDCAVVIGTGSSPN